jgi:hypothetical protein
MNRDLIIVYMIDFNITLFKSITMFFRIDYILQHIIHIQSECGGYSTKYSYLNLNNVMKCVLHKIIKQCVFVYVGLENIIMGCPNIVQI